MKGINEALKFAGNDSIKELFDFVSMRMEMADPDESVLEWVEALRTASDVGLAIYAYAVNKERICRE